MIVNVTNTHQGIDATEYNQLQKLRHISFKSEEEFINEGYEAWIMDLHFEAKSIGGRKVEPKLEPKLEPKPGIN